MVSLRGLYSGIKQKQPKNSPSPAGRSPQRGRDGVGVSNNIDESKAYFSRLLLSPQSSLAARAMLVPRGEGAYRRFVLLRFTTPGLNLGYFKFIPLQNTVCAASNPTPALPHGGRGLSGGYPGGGWQMICRFGFRFTANCQTKCNTSSKYTS